MRNADGCYGMGTCGRMDIRMRWDGFSSFPPGVLSHWRRRVEILSLSVTWAFGVRLGRETDNAIQGLSGSRTAGFVSATVNCENQGTVVLFSLLSRRVLSGRYGLPRLFTAKVITMLGVWGQNHTQKDPGQEYMSFPACVMSWQQNHRLQILKQRSSDSVSPVLQ